MPQRAEVSCVNDKTGGLLCAIRNMDQKQKDIHLMQKDIIQKLHEVMSAQPEISARQGGIPSPPGSTKRLHIMQYLINRHCLGTPSSTDIYRRLIESANACYEVVEEKYKVYEWGDLPLHIKEEAVSRMNCIAATYGIPATHFSNSWFSCYFVKSCWTSKQSYWKPKAKALNKKFRGSISFTPGLQEGLEM
ncbi:hypothetical protein BDF14DRAFT_662469 [Spinellus fusiger]|nr:hypothetical protein BDF14DRAFT_662469 [Spinellus fusiger]